MQHAHLLVALIALERGSGLAHVKLFIDSNSLAEPKKKAIDSNIIRLHDIVSHAAYLFMQVVSSLSCADFMLLEMSVEL